MRIYFINHLGGGFANHLDIIEGTTVGQLFEEKVGGDPTGYLIRVNRLPASKDQSLQENDRVSVTPIRIEGAR